MTLRQGCARVRQDPGAYKPLNVGECARVRQDRQGFKNYCARARGNSVNKTFFSREWFIGSTLAILAQSITTRRNATPTLAQPWRNPGAKSECDA